MYSLGEIVKITNHPSLPDFLGKIKQINENNCLIKVAFALGNNLIYKINNSNIVKIEDAPII